MLLKDISTFVCTSFSFLGSSSEFADISMISIHSIDIVAEREDKELPNLPRIRDKCVLYFNEKSQNENQSPERRPFDANAAEILKKFLCRQETPICFVFYGASEWDINKFHAEFNRVDVSLSYMNESPIYSVDLKNIVQRFSEKPETGDELARKKLKSDFSLRSVLVRYGESPEFGIERGAGQTAALARLCLFIGSNEYFKNFPCGDSCVEIGSSTTTLGIKREISKIDESCVDEMTSKQNTSPEYDEIQTFVYLDLETTGLGAAKNKITEISLIAVNRNDCKPCHENCDKNALFPLHTDILTFAIDPVIAICPEAAHVSKLDNASLEKRKRQPWSKKTTLLFHGFLQRQIQPVCLIAYRGNWCDFPFLRLAITNSSLENKFLEYFSADAYIGVHSMTISAGNKLDSYGLGNIYPKLTKKFCFPERHTAEGDTIAMIEVVRCIREPQPLVKWFDENRIWFMEKRKIRKKKGKKGNSKKADSKKIPLSEA